MKSRKESTFYAIGIVPSLDWVGAVGGFSAGMIFTNFAMTMVGL
ncbi:hypothetical protein ACFL5R_02085 [Pseudomonadota bacterium]